MVFRMPIILCVVALSSVTVAAEDQAQSAFTVTTGQLVHDSASGISILEGGVTVRIKGDQALIVSASSVKMDTVTRISTLEGPVRVAFDGVEITSDRLAVSARKGTDPGYVEITADKVTLTRQKKDASP